ncbi:MAG TPA: TonB-dependent receptor [Burkholderiales bacterium]|nr:TonB-dependent receptor [Burkholderiales bacterium]
MRCRAAIVLLAGLAGGAQGADNPATALETPAVNVIGTTPLPGIGAPAEEVPANVQVLPERALRDRTVPGVVEALDADGTSFATSQPEGNPYRPDVIFRGFSASPLLGTPQGLSVYQDGVRVNEAFGDVVNWDLIPRIAISSMQVIPGSNPVFGLNTLGGALALYTKSGFTYPGSRVAAYGGSYGRYALELETGGFKDDKDWYAAANVFRENGWREHSKSEINQFFGKVGVENDRDDFDLSLALADNTLAGTQALPLSMLGSPKQAYTWPDSTNNRFIMANARASRLLAPEHLLAFNVYVRDLNTSNQNSNVNDACATGPCTFTAFNDSTTIDELRVGGALQYTSLAPLAGRRNQLVVGISFDASRANFTGEEQEADFDASRQAIGISDFQTETQARTRQNYTRVYATDTYALGERLFLTGSLSYNTTTVSTSDATGTQPELDGKHSFSRWLPAAGIAWSPAPRTTYFANASTGMRAPTAIELTCADPAAPCRLPNVFLADPPLKPVLAQTFELGLRLPLGERGRLAAALFRTNLQDDIQFISSGGAAINAGYFQNIGRTRRQGIEFSAEATVARWTFAASASYVAATFQSPFTVFSPNNSSANAAGDIQVSAGDRIPGIPAGTLKLRAQFALAERATVGASLLAFSRQYARGDENNQDANGPVPGYAIVNLDAQWEIARGLQLFANIANLLNSRYATFGVLGQNFFAGPGNTFDAANAQSAQFRTPGAPFGVWVGVAYRFAEGGRSRQNGRD